MGRSFRGKMRADPPSGGGVSGEVGGPSKVGGSLEEVGGSPWEAGVGGSSAMGWGFCGQGLFGVSWAEPPELTASAPAANPAPTWLQVLSARCSAPGPGLGAYSTELLFDVFFFFLPALGDRVGL